MAKTKIRTEPWDWLGAVPHDAFSVPNDPAALTSKTSGLLQRVSEKRKAKQLEILATMRAEVDSATEDLEEQIHRAAQTMRESLSCLREEVDSRLLVCGKPDRENSPLIDLEGIVVSLQKNFEAQRRYVSEFSRKMEAIERERSLQVRPIVQATGEKMVRHASLVPGDVEHLMAEEAQLLNNVLINNREGINQAQADLKLDCLVRERAATMKVVHAHKKWKEFNLQRTYDKFKEFMASDAAVKPAQLEELIERLRRDQDTLSKARLKLFTTISSLHPPTSTRMRVDRWYTVMGSHFSELDILHEKFLEEATTVCSCVAGNCATTMENKRCEMVEKGYCSEQQSFEIMNSDFLPLVEEMQNRHNADLKLFERMLGEGLRKEKRLAAQIKDMAMGAAAVYDQAQERLEAMNDNFQGEQDKIRKTFSALNQNIEDNLQKAVTQLRESSAEDELLENLENVEQNLERQVHEYKSFCKQCQQVIKTYPSRLMQSFGKYEQSLLSYFSVSREPPGTTATTAAAQGTATKGRTSSMSRKPSQSRAPSMAGTKERKESWKQSGATTRRSRASGSSTAMLDSGALPKTKKKGDISEVVVDSFSVLHEHAEVTFYRSKTMPAKQSVKDSTFVTETPFDEVPEEVFLHRVVEKMIVNTSANDTQHMLCLGYLKHLLESQVKSAETAAMVVKQKNHLLEQELNAKKNMREPRLKRIKREIAQVRRSELSHHKQIMSTYCASTREVTSSIGKYIQSSREMLAEKAVGSLAEIERRTKALDNIGNLEDLQLVISSARKFFYEHKIMMDERVEEEHARIVEMLDGLVAKGKVVAANFVTFKDGGTFSPLEAAEYNQKLDDVASECGVTQHAVKLAFSTIISPLMQPVEDLREEFDKKAQSCGRDMEFHQEVEKAMAGLQVCILSQVAKSNRQAGEISHGICDLTRASRDDGETEEHEQLLGKIQTLSGLLRSRAQFLGCMKGAAPSLASKRAARTRMGIGSSGTSMRSMSEDLYKDPLSAISSTGSILDRQAPARQKDTFVGIPADKAARSKSQAVPKAKATNGTLKPAITGQVVQWPAAAIAEEPDLTESRTSRGNSSGSHRPPSSSRPQNPSAHLSSGDKKSVPLHQLSSSSQPVSRQSSAAGCAATSRPGSGMDRQHRPQATDGQLIQGAGLATMSQQSSLDSVDETGGRTSTYSASRSSSKYVQALSLEYKKCPWFGEDDSEMSRKDPEPTTFLAIIRRSLRGARMKILVAADRHYEKRGGRSALSMMPIPRTVADFMKMKDDELQAYRIQSETYYKSCLEEIGSHITSARDAILQASNAILGCRGHEHLLLELDARRRQVMTDYKTQALVMDQAKDVNQRRLTSDLCEASKQPLLLEITQQEQRRAADALSLANDYPKILLNELSILCLEYVQVMTSSFDGCVPILDEVMSLADVEIGEAEVKETSKVIGQLLRNADKPWMSMDDDADTFSEQPGPINLSENWLELVADADFKELFPACFPAQPSTGKTSAKSRRQKLEKPRQYGQAHRAFYAARNRQAKTLMSTVMSAKSEAEECRDKDVKLIQRWSSHWHASVEALQQLAHNF